MTIDRFQPGDNVTVTWTSLKVQHTGHVIAPEHSLDLRGYIVEYDDTDPAVTHWIPEDGLQPRDTDSQMGARP